MFEIFNALSIRKRASLIQSIMGTVAQLVILILILPGLIIILNSFFPEFTERFVVDTLDKIPFIEIISNYYKQYLVIDSTGSFKLFEFIIAELNESILSMYIVGLIINICKSIGGLIGIKGLAVFQTVVGVFLSAIALSFLGDSFEANIIATVILMAIAMLFSIVFSKSKIGASIMSMLEITLSVISSGTMCAYLTVLVLIAKGGFATNLLALEAFIWSTVPVLICLLIDYLVFGLKR